MLTALSECTDCDMGHYCATDGLKSPISFPIILASNVSWASPGIQPIFDWFPLGISQLEYFTDDNLTNATLSLKIVTPLNFL